MIKLEKVGYYPLELTIRFAVDDDAMKAAVERKGEQAIAAAAGERIAARAVGSAVFHATAAVDASRKQLSVAQRAVDRAKLDLDEATERIGTPSDTINRLHEALSKATSDLSRVRSAHAVVTERYQQTIDAARGGDYHGMADAVRDALVARFEAEEKAAYTKLQAVFAENSAAAALLMAWLVPANMQAFLKRSDAVQRICGQLIQEAVSAAERAGA